MSVLANAEVLSGGFPEEGPDNLVEVKPQAPTLKEMAQVFIPDNEESLWVYARKEFKSAWNDLVIEPAMAVQLYLTTGGLGRDFSPVIKNRDTRKLEFNKRGLRNLSFLVLTVSIAATATALVAGAKMEKNLGVGDDDRGCSFPPSAFIAAVEAMKGDDDLAVGFISAEALHSGNLLQIDADLQKDIPNVTTNLFDSRLRDGSFDLLSLEHVNMDGDADHILAVPVGFCDDGIVPVGFLSIDIDDMGVDINSNGDIVLSLPQLVFDDGEGEFRPVGSNDDAGTLIISGDTYSLYIFGLGRKDFSRAAFERTIVGGDELVSVVDSIQEQQK